MYNMGMCVDKPFLLFRFPDNHETKVPSESAANICTFLTTSIRDSGIWHGVPLLKNNLQNASLYMLAVSKQMI